MRSHLLESFGTSMFYVPAACSSSPVTRLSDSLHDLALNTSLFVHTAAMGGGILLGTPVVLLIKGVSNKERLGRRAAAPVLCARPDASDGTQTTSGELRWSPQMECALCAHCVPALWRRNSGPAVEEKNPVLCVCVLCSSFAECCAGTENLER